MAEKERPSPPAALMARRGVAGKNAPKNLVLVYLPAEFGYVGHFVKCCSEPSRSTPVALLQMHASDTVFHVSSATVFIPQRN